MPSFTSIAIATLVAAALGAVGWRDHRRLRASRRGLLDSCASLFHAPRLSCGGDDFPRLRGQLRGRSIDVQLIPDTMTIRRLPQLWMQVTLIEPVAVRSGFAALVRPVGTEFYSLTGTFPRVVEPRPEFPREMIIRGETADAAATVDRAAPALATILADPRNKEVAVTAKGARIIRQVGEGERGDYLLLRQAVFDSKPVAPSVLEEMVRDLETLAAALAVDGKVEAA